MASVDRRKLGIIAGAAAFAIVGAVGLTRVFGTEPPPPPPPATIREVVEVQMSEVEVLAATRDLIRGDVLMPTDFKWILWPEDGLSFNLFDKDSFPDATIELTGRAVLEPIFANEPISQQRLLSVAGGTTMSTRVSEGYRAFAAPIDAMKGVSGFVLPNDRVDLIWIFQDEQPSEVTGEMVTFQTAQHLMQNVRVLSVDQATNQIAVQGGFINARLVNIEIKPEHAEVLAIAMAEGQVFYTLRGVLDSNENNGEPTLLINPIKERYDALVQPEGEDPKKESKAPQIFKNGRPEGS